MNSRHRSTRSIVKWVGNFLTAWFVLTLLLTSCAPTAPAPATPPAIEPSATSAPVQPSPAPTQTVPPASTSTAAATLAPTQTPLPSPTSTPTTPPTPTPLPMIVLTDWKKGNFIETTSGCLFSDTQCWQTVVASENLKFNSKYLGHNHGAIARSISETSQSSLTSQTSLLIDPTWRNPHLVFWYDNQIDGNVNVFAKLDSETQPSFWETLMSRAYTSQNLSSLRWNVEALDLNRYKGQKIWISINAEIIVAPSQNLQLPFTTDKLHLQKILILPDYQPGIEDELGSVAYGKTSETSPVISSTQNLTKTSSSEPFQLSEWRSGGLAVLSSGCRFPDLICWESVIQQEEVVSSPQSTMNGTNIKATALENYSNLVARSSLFIDPAWGNPQLVFWFDNPFPGDLFVSVKTDLKWLTIAHVPLTGQEPGSWQMTNVDLSQFKGKPVLLSISATLKIPRNALQANTSTGLIRWHIQNIQIVPNFTPIP